MSVKGETQEFRLDWLKWLLVAALVAVGVAGNMYFADQSLLYRVLALLALALVAAFIAVNTAQGNAFWGLLKSAKAEVRKVVWPTKQETLQTTAIVVVVTLVVALILWGLDTFFGWLASLIIG